MSLIFRSGQIAAILAIVCFASLFSIATDKASAADPPKTLRLLFLGDQGHHRPAERAAQLIPVMKRRGIEIEYTEDMNSLNAKSLGEFDGLILYANIDNIAPEQAKALLDYVAGGRGFIPLHCASYCFRNNDDVVALIGGQFQRHGTGTFRVAATEAGAKHPLLKGYDGFESWDETYVHTKHNEKDRVVLEVRAEGDSQEPWTWVRTHGKGRVFYTAWGHDGRTWSQPGFQNLVERGIRWAVGQDPALVPEFRDAARFDPPAMTPLRKDVAPFEYVEVGAKIPNYTPGKNWGTLGKPLTQMQKPLPPAESIKHFVTPVGFEPRLYASEEHFQAKPIAMNWDERGRLWICETLDYPNELQPPGKGRDRVRVCEDTDGDYVADKFTVFAEGLSIPTAVLPCRGGAVVQDGVETLFLKDTDGDGRADVRRVLISGWGLGDTHGGVSNFQYGLDNWIWAMQGYNQSEPVIRGEKQPGFRQGFFRFRLDNADPPEVAEIEFIRSTNNNTWGIGISEEGLIFGSTANHNPSVYMPIANRYYERVRGWSAEQLGTIADTHLFKAITDKVRQVDQHGGYTAGAGHALYTARNYPRQWWNKTAFVCEPTGHLVGTFVLSRDGADFHSTSPTNLLASDDEWSAPIMAEVGPDGNVWVLDWYNFIVQHNPTPQGFTTGKGNAYESDLRDKKHGRIYRIVYTAGESAADTAPLSLVDAAPEKLVATLRHPNFLWRRQAQRLLVERGETDVVPALIALLQDQSADELGLNVGAIHAIWTLHGLGVFASEADASAAGQALRVALSHPAASVRRNALQALPAAASSLAAILDSSVLNDSDAQVRLAAILALADMPTAGSANEQAGQAAAALARDASVTGDRWLRDALTSAAATHAVPFLAALAAADDANSEPTLAVATIAAEHIARGKPSGGEIESLLKSLGSADPRVLSAVLAGLSKGWPRDHRIELSPAAEEAMVAMIERLPAGGKGQLIRLASLWGSKQLEKYSAEIVKSLLASVEDDSSETPKRIAAARQLVEFRATDDAIVAPLLDLITPQAEPEFASGLIDSLGASTAPAAGQELVTRLAAFTPAARFAAIRILLARPETTRLFLDGVEAGRAEFSDLKLDQKQALAAHPDKAIRERATALLAKGGGLPNADREAVLKQLHPLTERTGDAIAGKEVFKKNCSKCHMHSGEGTAIGPDLTGMAVHPKHELLTHLIDPSRSVEGNFRVYSVVTADGRVLTGMLAGESRTAIELIDAEAKRHAIPREDIDELVGSKKSLMPDGFEKQVTPDELANLLEFLTKRGQFTPLDLRKVASIVSTRGMFYDENSDAERLIFSDWKPKTFAGVPFQLIDPQVDRVPNVVLLHGPHGKFPPKMPKSVSLPVNQPAKAIHLLSGVGGWSAKGPIENGSVSMIVRLHYADGQTEDHELRDGVHFADYIGQFNVPGSQLAFKLRGQQIRYLSIVPKRSDPITSLDLIKGRDDTAPIVMAVTAEAR